MVVLNILFIWWISALVVTLAQMYSDIGNELTLFRFLNLILTFYKIESGISGDINTEIHVELNWYLFKWIY